MSLTLCTLNPNLDKNPETKVPVVLNFHEQTPIEATPGFGIYGIRLGGCGDQTPAPLPPQKLVRFFNQPRNSTCMFQYSPNHSQLIVNPENATSQPC